MLDGYQRQIPQLSSSLLSYILGRQNEVNFPLIDSPAMMISDPNLTTPDEESGIQISKMSKDLYLEGIRSRQRSGNLTSYVLTGYENNGARLHFPLSLAPRRQGGVYFSFTSR